MCLENICDLYKQTMEKKRTHVNDVIHLHVPGSRFNKKVLTHICAFLLERGIALLKENITSITILKSKFRTANNHSYF